MNNRFEYIDWSCLHSKMPRRFATDPSDESIEYQSWFMDSFTLTIGKGVAGEEHVVERNTILHHGASEGLQVWRNTVVRLNRIGHSPPPRPTPF